MELKTVPDVVRALPQQGEARCMSFKTDFRTFRFTYSQVHARTMLLADLLRRSGVRKGDRVILCAPNSPSWGCAFLATACVGAVVVPMDIRGTADFVERIAKEVKPRFAFIGKQMAPVRLSCERLALEPIWIGAELLPDPGKKIASPIVHSRPGDLLEIVYTSGTTGAPKGVLITHGNILSNARAGTEGIPLGRRDSSLSLLPLSHVFEQVGGFLAPLIHGGSIVYIERLNRRSMFEAIIRERPSFIPIVPRLLDMIKRSIEERVRLEGRQRLFSALRSIARRLPESRRRLLFPKVCRSFPLKRFRFFVAGGAPLDAETELFFSELGLPILQGYGLTETSPVLTMNSVKARRIGSVGRPIRGVEIKIGDDGEILARGPNVTAGYYRNPAKTKDLFTGGAEAWLKTGDLGLIDDEGFVHIKGRKKDMIVTSEGMNVYPEDVESALDKIPGVKDSAVVGFPRTGGEQVHAVLLLEKGAGHGAPLPRTIIAKANAALPSFARVTGFTVWPDQDFPRTPTMKVRKFQVLEFLERRGAAAGGKERIVDSVRPLYRIIAAVTKRPLEAIRPNSNLTSDLGLASLDRVELLSAIEDELGVELPDELVTPATAVEDLDHLVEGRQPGRQAIRFRPWILSWPIRALRVCIQNVFVFPILVSITRPVVHGKRHLRGLKGPVLIVCNHTSHLDTPLILIDLPCRLRERVAPVGLREYFQVKGDHPFKRFWMDRLYDLACVGGNMVVFPQTSGFGASMRYAGSIVDKGYNILVFPEGARTLDGRIKEFKDGVGMMAVNYRIPVLPVRVRGLFGILPRGKFWPRPGPSDISFGEPFLVETEDYHEATIKIEKAIKAL